ncbi:MAG: trans-sulfuration enzyme family protein [Alkalispirochaeta sp.]
MDLRPDTIAIRTQAERSPYNEHSVPIYATSGYHFDTAGTAADAFAGTTDHPLYGRFDNPNTDEFALKIARLEGTETAIATASGMGAIFTTLAALLRSGDHIVAAYQLFGSTLSLLNEFLPRWGIEATLVDGTDLAAWDAACRQNTRLFLCETPSNPGLEVADITALSRIAHGREALLVVDNCFATPVLQRPATFGADIVVHSATKFIDGQGRVLGGAIATSREVMERIMPFYRTTGPTMSAFNGWILSRGLETLAIRMEKHCDNAEELVRRFTDSGSGRVRYPGLPDHPQFELSRTQMRRPGALFTVDLGGDASPAMNFLDRLSLISRSVNLGDTRTIATHPYTTTHAKVPEAMKAKLGITPGLLRFSVGLENVEDIWTDIARALGT